MSTINHRRGDSFDKTLTLDGPASYYTELRFTIRAFVPPVDVLDDLDALAVAVSDDGITIDGVSVRVRFAASVTVLWPAGVLYWDLQGKGRDGDPDFVKTLDSGELKVSHDITRST